MPISVLYCNTTNYCKPPQTPYPYRIYGTLFQIYKTDGKVFFELDSSSSHSVDHLLSLKSVERLFVAAVHNPDFRIFSKAGRYAVMEEFEITWHN